MIEKLLRKFFTKTTNYFRNVGLKEIFILTLFVFIGFNLIFFFNYSRYRIDKEEKISVLKEGLFESVSTLNPLYAQNSSEDSISILLYPPLISPHNHQSLFIKKIEKSNDFLSYFIDINPEIKWSDGSKLSTEDIAFSFELYKNYGPKSLRDFIKNVNFEIIDDSRGVFRLNFIDNLFIERLSQIRLLPSKWWNKFSQDNLLTERNLFKVGMFYFLSRWDDKKQEIVLNRNLFLSGPKINQIIFKLYPNYINALHSLLNREIDALGDIRPESLSIISHLRYNFYFSTTPRIIFIAFNREKVKPSKIFLPIDFLKAKQYGEILNGLFPESLRKILNIHPYKQKEVTSEVEKFTLIATQEGLVNLIGKKIAELNPNIKLKFIELKDIQKLIEDKNYEALLLGIDYGFPPNLAYFWSNLGLFLNKKEDKVLEKQFQNLILGLNVNLSQTWSEIEDLILDSNQNLPIISPYYIYVIDRKIKADVPKFLPSEAYRFLNIYNWR